MPRRLAPVWARLLAVLLVPGAPSGGGVSAADPTIPLTPAETAVRFRSSMGLASDLATIRTAAIDSTKYPNQDYGIPLSNAEYEELLRRAGVQWDMGKAVVEARKDPTFAGAYIDQLAGGVPVFMFTAGPAEKAETVADLLPAGTTFRIVEAERTEADLLAIQDRIEASREALANDGISIISTGIVDDENAVEVGLTELTSAAATQLEADFGPGIAIRVVARSRADRCNGAGDCRPIKGGLKIVSQLDNGKCTSGFVVRRTDNDAIVLLTAGHCLHAHGGYDQDWEHNDNRFGKARRDTWTNGASRNADVGLITIGDDEEPADKNEIHVGGGNVRKVVNWAMASEQVQYGQAILLGYNSGYTPGQILSRNVSRPSEVAGWGTMTVLKTMEVDFDATDGDSGGPFFYVAPSGGVNRIALGTHVHSVEDGTNPPRAWYSPIDTGSDTYENLHDYGYRICYTADC